VPHFSAVDLEEDGKVAVVQDFVLPDREMGRFVRVVEPELDMHRIRPRTSALGRIFELLRWLTPTGREMVGPPRRSVGRELEEAWPSVEK
jgi:hypothetical protein